MRQFLRRIRHRDYSGAFVRKKALGGGLRNRPETNQGHIDPLRRRRPPPLPIAVAGISVGKATAEAAVALRKRRREV